MVLDHFVQRAQGQVDAQVRQAEDGDQAHVRDHRDQSRVLVTNPAATMPGKFTWDEVKRHGTRKDAWIVVHGKVYNVTHFLNDHPGGWEIMEPYFGTSGGASTLVACSRCAS